MKPLLLFLALLAPLAAAGAEWLAVPAPRSADLYYYDASKLVIEGDEATYWKKVLFKTPQPVKGLAAASGLFREQIHCRDHTLKPLSYLLQAADGAVIEYTETKDAIAAPIIPESIGDLFEQTLCPLVRQKQEEAKRKAEEAAAKAKTPPPEAAKSPEAKPAPPAAATPAPATPPAPEKAKASQPGL